MSESGLPSVFIPHGGGPCFFMDWNPPETWKRMEAWLRTLVTQLGARPKALLIVSAHWEAEKFSVTTHSQPDLIYDYYGFPAHTYQITWPAPGAPELAAEICDLLESAGISAGRDPQRGLDHGVFIPMKLAVPDADIPVVQFSLRTGLDPAEHIAAGKALAPLRRRRVLIVGSGMSYHNLRRFFANTPGIDPDSQHFDDWLTETVTAPQAQREQGLLNWAQAPGARGSHPREEHLLPLHVVAGAAGADAGTKVFEDQVMGSVLSAFAFGGTDCTHGD